MVITFQVFVPKNASEKQKQLLKEFAHGEEVPSVTEYHMRHGKDRRS
jgi:hypothetical protein